MKISVIVGTYNRPNALRIVIKALLNQEQLPSEIIIADDGSGEKTRDLVSSLQENSAVKIIHAWQEDEGFRLAKIRNLAVSKSTGDFLVFLDGDCIPLASFISRYKELAEPGHFNTGSRIAFNGKLTNTVIGQQSNIHKWPWHKWLKNRLSRKVKRLSPLLTLPAQAKWRYRTAVNWRKLRGCNMACFCEDYLTVNGFDEKFEGWGREDSDFAIRLINAGVRRKDARFAVPVMHLWHPEGDRSSLEKNDELLEEVLSSKKIRATLGVDQYL